MVTFVSIKQVQAFTQFYFDIPDQSLANGTQFKAGTDEVHFVWTLDNQTYTYSFQSDDNSTNLSPIPNEYHIIDFKNMFAIDTSLPIGESVSMCVSSDCQSQVIDEKGRVHAEFG